MLFFPDGDKRIQLPSECITGDIFEIKNATATSPPQPLTLAAVHKRSPKELVKPFFAPIYQKSAFTERQAPEKCDQKTPAPSPPREQADSNRGSRNRIKSRVFEATMGRRAGGV